MEIKPLREDLKDFIKEHNLAKKWEKAKRLFESNVRHPSLDPVTHKSNIEFIFKNLMSKGVSNLNLTTKIMSNGVEVELLEPRWRGIYYFTERSEREGEGKLRRRQTSSTRLNKKYRALFFITEGKAEVFQITKHYKKG